MFLEALDLRSKKSDDHTTEVETAVIGAFMEIVTKLNEASFKPLFRRMFDWAFTGEPTESRQIAFLNLMTGLLETFKVCLACPVQALVSDYFVPRT